MSQQASEVKASSSDFIFCHCPTSLRDVIMLKNHDKTLNKIIKDVSQPYYFWLYEDKEYIQNTIKKLSHNIQNRSNIFTSMQQMEDIFNIEQNRTKYKKIIVISCTEKKYELFLLTRQQRFICFIFYDPHTDVGLKLEQNVVQPNQFFNNIEHKRCKTLQQLNKILNLNKWSFSEPKELLNFVLLKQQVQKSTVLYRIKIAKNILN